MCGIVGIVELNSSIDQSLLENMVKVLVHRGPDDQGYCLRNTSDFSIGLASCRLSIIDLTPAGHMPMTNLDETIWITYNGEIYNHLTLREELEKKYHFKSRTDTETLMYAYEAYGLEAFKMLNGIFSTAIFDQRNQSLILARDRMGVKPLYYYWDGETLVFASELKAILVHPKVSRKIDLDALNIYLALGYVPSPYSLLADIHKLEPGNILLLKNRHINIRPFWAPIFLDSRNDRRSFQELVEATRQTVENAVKNQLMSDVPVGVMLSGGLDSTIITALTKKYHNDPLHTFSIGFRTGNSVMDPDYNWDSNFASYVAHQLRTHHHEVIIHDTLKLKDQLEGLIFALDEPLWEASYLSIYMMSRLAREFGIKVLLSGDGSDELFGGYSWYAGALRLANYDKIPYLSPFLKIANAILPPSTLRTKTIDFSGKYRQVNYMKYIVNYQHLSAEVRSQLLSGNQGNNVDCLPDFIRETLNPVKEEPIADQFAFADLRLWVCEHFNQRVDRMTMQVSIEGRVPFQDNHIVDLALSIGMKRKIIGQVKKALLVEAFRGEIPQEVLKRPKRPFAVPAKAWLQGILQNYVKEIISETSVNKMGVLDARTTREIFDSFHRSERSFATLNDVRAWNLISLCIWINEYHAYI